MTDQDQSVFDDNSMTNNTPEEEQPSDDDSFEVLSFEAAPENTLYIKGIHLSLFLSPTSDILF